jgi:hypothetical protein
MSWTKRSIIESAFGELAIAGYVYDLSPQELTAALLKLDTGMASLPFALPYAFGTSPSDTDLDQDSGLPLWAVEFAYKRLAIDIAASKGKQLARSTVVSAKDARNNVQARIERDSIQQQQLRSGVPLGAGSRNLERPFTQTPDTSPLQVSGTGDLQFLGD